MNIPNHLKHKPVFVAEGYDQIDGQFARTSDAHGLSLGLAQWNERGNVDISAKVWRYTGKKWSRQSEELPLHRVLDLALLICEAHMHLKGSSRGPNLYDPENPTIGRVELKEGPMNVRVNTANEMIEQDIALFRDSLGRDRDTLETRFIQLARLLRELGY